MLLHAARPRRLGRRRQPGAPPLASRRAPRGGPRRVVVWGGVRTTGTALRALPSLASPPSSPVPAPTLPPLPGAAAARCLVIVPAFPPWGGGTRGGGVGIGGHGGGRHPLWVLAAAVPARVVPTTGAAAGLSPPPAGPTGRSHGTWGLIWGGGAEGTAPRAATMRRVWEVGTALTLVLAAAVAAGCAGGASAAAAAAAGTKVQREPG